ncbi:hypothetical protein BDN72DRAFT_794854 [Pluteus cervinus]|uniref:Uncharacterized protein n=1 Tax=Pluteus cervinus TaxID=181527 RepID=A0ACD3AYQ9_9AGAR|nr:hypothetical protein BDN72DRAFT_794854 [Pluteus cervinus]
MASPYVYTPAVSYTPTPYTQNLSNTPMGSPYIPPQPFGHSPYTPVASLPHTPQTPSHPLPNALNLVPFPGFADPSFVGAWDFPPRQRRLSGYGGNEYAPYPPFGGHVRRHSFNGQYPTAPPMFQYSPFQAQTPLPQSTLWLPAAAPTPAPTTIQIHPGLDGLNWRGHTHFNLSLKEFAPSKYLSTGQFVLLSPDDLGQQATIPAMTNLRIICDLIPQWPIDIRLDASQFVPGTIPPPIKVLDVFIVVHKSLQEQISHNEWRKLTEEDVLKVSKAYTRRCRLQQVSELNERKEGVKKVDFLLKNIWFRGLVPTPDPTVFKLVVGP